MYPICHERREFFDILTLRLDPDASCVHFWDPMMNRLASTAQRALNSAAMSRAGAMLMIMTITTTTRTRGANG